MKFGSLTACVALLGSLAACSDSPTAIHTSWVSMRLPVQKTFDGAFYLGGGNLSIYSQAQTGSSEHVLIWRPTDDLPSVGTHGLAFPYQPNQPPLFAATFNRDLQGIAETYIATSGFVTLLTARTDRIEGHYSFQAALVCRISNDPTRGIHEGTCSTTTPPPSDVPHIEVSGSFSVSVQKSGLTGFGSLNP